MKLVKDDGKPPVRGLFCDPKTGTFYFRRYRTGVGEIFRSLRTTNRYKAILELNTMAKDLSKVAPKPKEIVVDDVVLELYDIYQGQAKATFEGFELYCRLYILPYFTGKPIMAIKQEWAKFKSEVKRSKPGMSLVHVKKHATRILNYSEEAGYIDAAPKLKLMASERIERQSRAYKEEEVDVLINIPRDLRLETELGEHKFKAHTLEKLELQNMLVLFAGVRPPSEFRLLKWEYIDLSGEVGCIDIPADIVKNRKARQVFLVPELAQALRDWKAKQRIESPYVFPKRGKPMEPSDDTDRSWQRLKKALDIKGTRYFMRHTHGTAASESGMGSVVIAKNMGTSTKVLEKVYVHSSDEAKKRQVNAVYAQFRPRKS